MSLIQPFKISLTHPLTYKPSPVSVSTLAANDNRLKQSSGQVLILLKILPFLLNDVDSDYVTFIVKLSEIVQKVLAPIISLQMVLRLKIMIEQHLPVPVQTTFS